MSTGSTTGSSGIRSSIDSFFHITERGSNIRTEIWGGVITFLSMLYILVVNPLILAGPTGMDFQQLATATALASFVSCMLMGLYAKFPVALAPGMGINAFVAFTIVQFMGFDYYQALMVVLVTGILFFIMSVTGIRTKILNGIPPVIKASIGAGIGFFIVVVGLYNAGIIVHGDGSALMLGQLGSPGVLLGLVCINVTIALWYLNRWYAILAGALLTLVIGLIGGQLFGWDTTVDGTSLIPGVGTAAITSFISLPDMGLFGAVFTEFTMFDLTLLPAFIVATISLLVVDMFDTTGTLFAVGESAGIMNKDGVIEGNEKALQVDAVATMFGAVAGTSTTTSFIESATGLAAGARTGLMAVTVGVLFFLAMFFSPTFAVVTSACTVGALVMVGFMMIRHIKGVDMQDPICVATAFTTMFMMGLSGSITDGIAFGTFIYLLGMTLTGRRNEVSMTMAILGLVFLGYLVVTYGVIPNM
jgi:AGZA family xanthine/uracil permease-like MFS transporter